VRNLPGFKNLAGFWGIPETSLPEKDKDYE
jgi:hypothetical protein